MQLTVIDDKARQVNATIDGARILLDPADFAIAVGWEAKPQGFCQRDVCIPYTAANEVMVGDQLDLVPTMAALGRPTVAALEDGVVAVGQRAEIRRSAVHGSQAAPFALPDLNGDMRRLSEFAGQKKVLHAFASW